MLCGPHMWFPKIEEVATSTCILRLHACTVRCTNALFLIWTCIMIKHSDLLQVHISLTHTNTQFWGSLGRTELTAQCHKTQKADWVRKGQNLAQIAFWTQLGVFEDPGLPQPPFGLNLYRILVFVWWKFPSFTLSLPAALIISVLLSCRCQLVECVSVCVRAGTCVFPAQSVFGAECGLST